MEEMEIVYTPLSEVEKWPRNPKDHDESLLAVSIGTHGFNDPPAVDERSGRLVEGHGRIDVLRDMKAKGEDPPDRISVRSEDGEWMVPVVRGIRFESDEQAQAYLLAHNRITEKGGWNQSELQLMLQELVESGDEVLTSAGFSTKELDELTAMVLSSAMLDSVGAGADRPSSDGGDVVNDPAAEWEGMPEFHQEDKREFRSIILKFKDLEAVQAFEELTGQPVPENQKYMWYPNIEIERYADKRYATEVDSNETVIYHPEDES